MILRCWGTRGSLPVSGRQFLRYGGNTTCFELRTRDDETIIIDAGSGIRELGNRLLREGRHRYHLILTHTHWDHLIGFPFFKPLYLKKTRIKILGCPFAQKSVHSMVSRTMARPNFPVDFSHVQATIHSHGICQKNFRIGSVRIQPILLSHPDQGLGFKFTEGRRTLVFLTDNELHHRHPGGLSYDDYVDLCRGADLLLHDADFTEAEYPRRRTWGHSTYIQAAQLAMDAGVPRLGLIHHNQERIDKGVDRIVRHARRLIAEARSPLKCFAVRQGMTLRV